MKQLIQLTAYKITSKSSTNHYQTLGVSSAATQQQIKQSYYEKAKLYHPDVNQDPKARQNFSDVSKAYEILGDLQKKCSYDQ